jgi:hypothetical protein
MFTDFGNFTSVRKLLCSPGVPFGQQMSAVPEKGVLTIQKMKNIAQSHCQAADEDKGFPLRLHLQRLHSCWIFVLQGLKTQHIPRA